MAHAVHMSQQVVPGRVPPASPQDLADALRATGYLPTRAWPRWPGWRCGCGARCCSRASPAPARPRWPRRWPRARARRWCGCSATRASTPPRRSTTGTSPGRCCTCGRVEATRTARVTGRRRRRGALAVRRAVPARAAGAAGAAHQPERPAGRRDRPGRRRVRGLPARGALDLVGDDPRARAPSRRRTRRSWSSPPTAPARCTTPSSAAASTTGSSTPALAREVEILRTRLPEVPRGARRAGRRRASQRLREPTELLKPPGRRRDPRLGAGLVALGARDSTPRRRPTTLGAVLKYREDADAGAARPRPAARRLSGPTVTAAGARGRARDPAEEILLLLGGSPAPLRAAGVPVTPDRTASFLAAAAERRGDATGPASTGPAAPPCAATPTTCAAYDQVFAALVRGRAGRARRRRNPCQRPRASPVAEPADAGSGGARAAGGGAPEPAGRGQRAEVLRHRDVAELDRRRARPAGAVFAGLRPRAAAAAPVLAPPAGAPRASSTPRRTLREELRRGGEPGRLRHRPPRAPGPRRVVLLVDVSGSMTPYADALLRLAHVWVAQRAAAPRRGLHAWAPGSPGSPRPCAQPRRRARAARRPASRCPTGPAAPGSARCSRRSSTAGARAGWRAARSSWSSQRRLGARRRPALLAEQMARLRRLAHRVVWVNPHRGKAGYRPVQGGIVAVLPHVDDFVAGHSLATFAELMEVVAPCVRCCDELIGWWRAGETVGVGTVVATWRSAPRPRRRRRCSSARAARPSAASPAAASRAPSTSCARRSSRRGAPGAAALRRQRRRRLRRRPDLRRHPRRVRRAGRPRRRSPSSARSPPTSRPGDPVAVVHRHRAPATRAGRAAAGRPARRGQLGAARSARRAPDDAVTDDARGLLAAGAPETLTYGPDGERRGEGMRVFVAVVRAQAADARLRRDRLRGGGRPGRALPRLPASRSATRGRCSRRARGSRTPTRSSSSGRTATSRPRRRPGASTAAPWSRAHPRPEVRRAAARGRAAAAGRRLRRRDGLPAHARRPPGAAARGRADRDGAGPAGVADRPRPRRADPGGDGGLHRRRDHRAAVGRRRPAARRARGPDPPRRPR